MYKLILHLLQTYKGLSNRSSDTSFTNDSIIGKKAPWAVKKTFASNTEVEGRYKGKDIIPSHLGKQIKSGSRSNVWKHFGSQRNKDVAELQSYESSWANNRNAIFGVRLASIIQKRGQHRPQPQARDDTLADGDRSKNVGRGGSLLLEHLRKAGLEHGYRLGDRMNSSPHRACRAGARRCEHFDDLLI